MAVSALQCLSLSRFLEDIKKASGTIGATYSESTTKKVLEVFGDRFIEDAVELRVTNKPKAELNYRFYQHTPKDTVNASIEGGLLKPKTAVLSLISSMSTRWDNATTHCDFDTETGFSKF